MLPGRHRLRRSADFAAVFRGARGAGGSRSGSHLMVVHANSTDARAGQPPRVGFVVSKGVGNAVVRNRTKRVLRPLMNARIERLPDGLDVVVRANPDLAGTATATVAQDLDRLLATVLRRVGSQERTVKPV
ncbi:MAG TPA: ribonuclease P protein component [Dermatophilaceae bacterium]